MLETDRRVITDQVLQLFDEALEPAMSVAFDGADDVTADTLDTLDTSSPLMVETLQEIRHITSYPTKEEIIDQFNAYVRGPLCDSVVKLMGKGGLHVIQVVYGGHFADCISRTFVCAWLWRQRLWDISCIGWLQFNKPIRVYNCHWAACFTAFGMHVVVSAYAASCKRVGCSCGQHLAHVARNLAGCCNCFCHGSLSLFPTDNASSCNQFSCHPCGAWAFLEVSPWSWRSCGTYSSGTSILILGAR